MTTGSTRMTFDRERVHFNLARLKTHGAIFEIVVDPDKAVEHKQGKDVAIGEVLRAEKIFSDAKKGLAASEEQMQAIFETKDPVVIAEKILKEGELQLTSEYREKVRETKRKKIIEIIHRNGVDPRTQAPHPVQRIENAFEEAKVHIDEYKRAEDQVHEILRKLQPILPIRFEIKDLEIHIPTAYAPKMYGTVSGYAVIKKDEWQNDGSWLCVVEIPAGLQTELMDELNNKTHGNVQIKVIGTR